VAGKTFTMGDIVVGVHLYRWSALDVKRPVLALVEAYHERLKQRPVFRNHIMKPLT
jgi:glutathione S-transferase